MSEVKNWNMRLWGLWAGRDGGPPRDWPCKWSQTDFLVKLEPLFAWPQRHDSLERLSSYCSVGGILGG